MAVTQSQIEGLAKQVFILEYLLNGLFPCQSDIVRLIRANKREWNFNDKFEYRMLLATTNSGGTLNSQVFKSSVGLNRPGALQYGVYQATYGTVSDGMEVDMTANLETENKKAAFDSDFATKMHSLRTNVAALFKNFAIHGKWGVVHQLRSTISAPSTGVNPKANTAFTPTVQNGTTTYAEPFTIAVPIDVFNSNFKAGKYLIKTCPYGSLNTTAADSAAIAGLNTSGADYAAIRAGTSPASGANTTELYLILDNQPGLLTLISVGTSVTEWKDGEFLEVAFNREIQGTPTAPFDPDTYWTSGAVQPQTYTEYGTEFDQYIGGSSGYTAAGQVYTYGVAGIVGAMEGLSDLLPFYTDPVSSPTVRFGTELPFRGAASRTTNMTEQCGGWVYQGDDENIIDAILRGVFLTKSTVPAADIGVWINPMTKQQMGYEEGESVYAIRDNLIEGPIVYQRGIQSTDYQIGNSVIREVVEDLNLPTDVIIIGPKKDMSYNCWDNATAQIDDYIQSTWSSEEPPKIEDISVPDEFVASLDLSSRITYGSPTLSDQSSLPDFTGSGIRHPKNVMPMALHEMGAIFTEYPYCYTVVKLQGPIVKLGAAYKPA